MSTRHIALLCLLLATVSVSTGCSTIAKETVGLVRGASGSMVARDPVSEDPAARPLGEYTQFELGPFTDDFGKTPASLFTHLETKFAEQLADSRLANRSGGKTLVARGTVIHYESEDLIGMAISPVEEVVARVELVDGASGQVLGTANCVGRGTTRTTLGVEQKAAGLSKAILSWIEKRYPKPEEN